MELNSICDLCGHHTGSEWYEHSAQIYSGRSYHLTCIRKMFSKSPKETLSPYSRVERIILRLSRNKVLLPYDVSDICHRIAPKLRKRHKSILPEWWDCGALGEAPLFVTSLYPRDVFEFCDIADKLPKDSFEFNLAVLLFVMGDKHAVRHATSRSSAKFWRGKAVNS